MTAVETPAMIGAHVTAPRFPARTFRGRIEQVSGVVTAVGPNALTLVTPGGYVTVPVDGAEVRL